MKRTMCFYLLLAVLLASLSACGAPEEAATTGRPAVGAIFVHRAQELPENTKVYADFENHTYSFGTLDAACVYYFSADEDVAYAGTQKFYGLRFAANIDADTVGAAGTIAYRAQSGETFSAAAYYLYLDESGMYFDTNAPFTTAEIADRCTLTGTDYACEVMFVAAEPADRFTITQYGADRSVLSMSEYDLSAVEDYQRFDLDSAVVSVDVVRYASDGRELSASVVTPDAPSVVICDDDGGRILPSKALRFVWTQP